MGLSNARLSAIRIALNSQQDWVVFLPPADQTSLANRSSARRSQAVTGYVSRRLSKRDSGRAVANEAEDYDEYPVTVFFSKG